MGHAVILTHEHTDFDALASLLGAHLLYPDAIPVLTRQMNRNVRAFLSLYRNQFPFVEPGQTPRGHVDRAILVDSRSVNAVKGMDDATRYLVIDHHSVEEPLPTGWEIWQEGLGDHAVGANTTLLVEKLMVQDRDLSDQHATLLALGIYEDTGSMLYKSTTHRDVRCAAWLLEQGANLEVIYRFTHFPMSQAQQALAERLLGEAEHLEVAGQTLVIATARAPDFDDELSALAHKMREVYEPDGVFVVVDLGDRVQVVARSSTDAVDVGRIAEGLGGGGHTRAAAALIRGSDLESVRQRILDLSQEHVRPPVTVRQIMSRGRPQTLTPEMAVEEAMERMRRYGHEGFPVVEKVGAGAEQLVGILTRRETDRAINHRMGSLPVHKVMRAGSHTIGADAPVDSLHRLMIQSGWGQIPVVDENERLIGIVTRTDLIKLWGDEGSITDQIPDASRQLADALTPIQHGLLRLAGETASELGFAVYVVGGFVRDLLLASLERENRVLDMDLVVEGDAIALVQQMQARCGGRVVTHRRFGTAKWILGEAEHPFVREELPLGPGEEADPGEVPPHLDFVTARTEFYTEPTVLPTVEQGSIKLDLHRRDFTINTLAIVLTPDRWGDLLDFYGGLDDVQDGVIRVLHSLSFVDDPTRILRAVRYEQRFDFHIDARTLELLVDAEPLLDRVSPARVRHELERILQEREPEKALRRLDELQVLQRIHPRLRAGEHLGSHFVALRRRLAAGDPLVAGVEEPMERLYWGLLVYPILPADGAEGTVEEELSERLKLRGETQRLMARLHSLKQRVAELIEPDQPPSRIVEILRTTPPAGLLLLSILQDEPLLQERLQRFVTEWQHVRPSLDGNDLRRMGMQPGPIYGQVLARLRAALLDGEIQPGQEEVEMAAQILATHTPSQE